MIEVRENKIYRDWKMIGWFSGEDMYDNSQKKLCHVDKSANAIYDPSGKKMAYIEGGILYDEMHRKIDIDDIIQKITAIGLPNIVHVAVSIYFAE